MRRLLITLALGLAAATGLQAQAWPSKPVTLLLLPFPPAGSADLIARTIAPQPLFARPRQTVNHLPDKLNARSLAPNLGTSGGRSTGLRAHLGVAEGG